MPTKDDTRDRGTMQRTSVPGVYRRGDRYTIVFRDQFGRQRKKTVDTLPEAKRLKAKLWADVARGSYRDDSLVRFCDHWRPWIDTYAGRTTRGIRQQTIHEYRRDLERYAAPYFGRAKLAHIDAPMIRGFLGSLADRGLAPATIRRIYAPVRALFADAAADGVIPTTPTTGVRIPTTVRHPEPRPKALTTDEVRALLAVTPPQHRLLVELLLVSGLRFSEAAGLRWSDINIGTRTLTVTRRIYHGTDRPKSRHGTRTIPLPHRTVQALVDARSTTRWTHENDPVFASQTGTPIDYSNTFQRVLRPALRRAGITTGGFHRLRHTCATVLFDSGANAVAVSRLLGHGDPAFTLRTYIHADPTLLPDLDMIFEAALDKN